MAKDDDIEKQLEEYKQELKDHEKEDYDKRTPEEKTEWLRCCSCDSVLPPPPQSAFAPCMPRPRRMHEARTAVLGCARRQGPISSFPYICTLPLLSTPVPPRLLRGACMAAHVSFGRHAVSGHVVSADTEPG